MAENKSRQKSRTGKMSGGERRSSRKVKLTALQKVQMGKGFLSLPQHQENHKPKRMKRPFEGKAEL